MKTLGSRASIFPLPVFDFPHQTSSCSRRVVQRYNTALNITKLANNTIHALNHLNTSYCKFPLSLYSNHNHFCSYSSLLSSFYQSYPSYPYSYNNNSQCQTRHNFISQSQSRMLSHINRCATRYFYNYNDRRQPSSSMVMSDEHIYNSSFSYSSLRSSAIPIIASQVSLPSSAGSANLIDLLPPHLSSTYMDPSKLLRPIEQVKKTSRVLKFASSEQHQLLIQRLHSLNMIDFTTDPKVINGYFGVPKDEDKIRLIIDARPANNVFIDPPKVELPTPDLLANLVAPTDQPFYVAKVDLDNFYHRLILPEWLRPYFALPPVRAVDVGLESKYGTDTLIYPCCKTLPMGWSHSVYLAQAAHEHLINTKTNLKSTDRINLQNDLHLNRPRHQVYIDDLNMFGHDPIQLAKLQQEYIEAVESHGLPVKISKVVKPSQDGVDCVGLEVHGARHEVGVNVNKLHQLCYETINFINSYECSGIQLSQLVGKWTWASLINRPLLSVFSSVYRYIQCAGNRIFNIWSSVKRELFIIMQLAPLMFTTLEDAWFDRIIATDASSTGQGVVASTLHSSDIASTLTQPNPYQFNWSTIVSSQWKYVEHINILEVRAISTAVRWVLSFPQSIQQRIVILTDSLVSLFSISKGRSSSHHLLPRLRTLASLLLGSGNRLYLRYVPTEDNPADMPSRL